MNCLVLFLFSLEAGILSFNFYLFIHFMHKISVPKMQKLLRLWVSLILSCFCNMMHSSPLLLSSVPLTECAQDTTPDWESPSSITKWFDPISSHFIKTKFCCEKSWATKGKKLGVSSHSMKADSFHPLHGIGLLEQHLMSMTHHFVAPLPHPCSSAELLTSIFYINQPQTFS